MFIKANNKSGGGEEGSKQILLATNPIFTSTTEETAFYLRGNKEVRISRDSNSVYLKSTKTNGSISSVTIASSIASTSFKIRRVRYLTASQAILEYCYLTEVANPQVRSNIYARIISMKIDGTINLSSQTTIGDNEPTTTNSADEVFIKMLYDNRFINIRWNKTISSNATSIMAYLGSWNAKNVALNVNSSAVVNVSSSANALINDMSLAPSRGGFFYQNASSQSHIAVAVEQNGGIIDLTLANANTTMNSLGITEHYVLGMTTNGLIVTAKSGNGIYLWYFDPYSTSNAYELISSIPFTKFGPLALWFNQLTIPYYFCYGSAVIFDGKIHVLGSNAVAPGNTCYTKHYSYDGSQWIQESTLPYNFYNGSAVVFDNKIHILGSSDSSSGTNHYSWNGTSWVQESTLPYNFYSGSAVVFDNKIHILGSSSDKTNHYSYNGSQWVQESTLPYNFYRGSAVVFDNKIHILGGYGSTQSKQYSYDGSQWVQESTLPYYFYDSSAVVFDNKIHILGGNNNTSKHYSYDGFQWTQESTLPYNFYGGSAVVFDNMIHTLGGYSTVNADKQRHYTYDGVTVGSCPIISFTNNILTMEDGTRYLIDTDNTLKELKRATITKVSPNMILNGYIGSESDPYEGVYVYESSN